MDLSRNPISISKFDLFANVLRYAVYLYTIYSCMPRIKVSLPSNGLNFEQSAYSCTRNGIENIGGAVWPQKKKVKERNIDAVNIKNEQKKFFVFQFTLEIYHIFFGNISPSISLYIYFHR